MTLEGIRYWGHHHRFPAAYRKLVAQIEADDGVGDATVRVLEENGEVAAFYDLRDRGDHIELLRMFQTVDRIGTGYGRLLWDDCVATASRRADRMLIISDPGAAGFYARMGAQPERTVEPVPGFELTVFWYALPVDGPRSPHS